jgi:alpha-D-xyloside xylohydrolase
MVKEINTTRPFYIRLRRQKRMKFEEGQWRLLAGTEAIYPVNIVDAQIEPDAITVTGFDHVIKDRNDYIHGTIITARFSSPMPNVIRVQLTHFKGRRDKLPVFDLDYAATNATVETGRDEEQVWLKAGRLAVYAPTQGEWGFRIERDGERLTGSEAHGVALLTQNGKTYIREQLSLQTGETVYGLGERFGAFVKNGQAVDIWNEDGGTMSEYAYKNVPFYLTSQGYGVLVNHPGKVSFEVGSHHVNRVQFSATGHSLDYYIFGGPTPKQALEQYTALSGRPAILPEWSFGLWLTTSFTTDYDEEMILSNIDHMEELGIPIRVFHFDCFWMKELTWCSFLWDKRNFPDPEGMLRKLKDKGIKVCMWINPYIAEASPLFAEGKQNGFLLHDREGNVFQVDHWQPGMGFVDFTNPQACAWYAGKLKTLVDMGVDAFKTDFGERIPTEVRYHDDSDPERMHNYYTYLYNKTVFELLEKEKGKGEAVLFARSATAGNQKYPVHWGGDNSSTYESMAETLRGGLSLGLSGYGYWSHDISGFIGKATADLYKRWVAFGLLSSHSRLHGYTSVRMPWLFDEESVDVLRFFNQLKNRIMPYVRSVATEAHEHGWPMLRAMTLEYPDDLTCRHVDMQYMLGSALLIAPVFSAKGEVNYYLPEGEWRNLLTGELTTKTGWRKEKHGYFGLPMWVNVAAGEQWDCLKGLKQS